MADDGGRPTSGEINVLILDLLREQRADVKAVAATTQATAVAVAGINGKLEVGEQRMDDHQRRLEQLERSKRRPDDDDSGTDYRPSSTKRKAVRPAAEAETETLTVKKKPAQDYSTWIKIGLLIGAVIAGAMAGKAVP
jgi:hypothetical protein